MTTKDVNDAISSAGFVSRSGSGRLPSRSGKQEGKGDDLNVRVRERSTTGTEERPKSRLGSFLSKRGGSGDNVGGIQSIVGNNVSGTSSIEKKANEIKEQIKRPLSSLFRRTQSNERSQQGGGGITITNKQGSNLSSNNTSRPAAAPLFANRAGSNRVPSAVGGRSTTLITGMGTSGTENNENAANGGAANGVAFSTTATRPFTGFPGTKRESIKQQNDENNTKMQMEMDLSEQAAIAPSMRRFSGFSADPSSLFLMKQQKQQINKGNKNLGDNSENGGEIDDVNFLSRFLCPEDEIQDENIPWTWDSLFASVTSELREEWALEEEAANSGGGGVNDQMPGGGIPANNLQQKGY
uniref:Uncharacterized protein n=1 Tax=Meloidogyne incognita TaxID=6306 RepID=A0A914NBN7_MELIC